MDTIKKAMIESMEATGGNVQLSAKQVKISRQTHYNWMDNDPEYKKQVDDVKEACIDIAEGELRSQIRQGNVTAIIFYLKTQGRGRGYGDVQEINMNANVKNVGVETITPEMLNKIKNIVGD